MPGVLSLTLLTHTHTCTITTITEWYWKLWVRPWSYKVAAVLLAVLSFVIVWCEATFSIQQYRLSVFAQIVYALHGLHNYYNYFMVEVKDISGLDIQLESKSL